MPIVTACYIISCAWACVEWLSTAVGRSFSSSSSSSSSSTYGRLLDESTDNDEVILSEDDEEKRILEDENEATEALVKIGGLLIDSCTSVSQRGVVSCIIY